jgi:prevent-host-death family protein
MNTGHVNITATDFKARCLELLDRVHRTGEELVISKRGRPVARLIAEREEKPWIMLRGKGRFVGDPFAPVIEDSDIEALK